MANLDPDALSRQTRYRILGALAGAVVILGVVPVDLLSRLAARSKVKPNSAAHACEKAKPPEP